MSTTAVSVFLIEDAGDNYLLLEQYLRLAGPVNFNGRGSGRQFFKWVTDNPRKQVDVIFLDLQMPSMDGFAVLKEIRQQPQFAGTKVIAYSAFTEKMAQCRAAGFDGFLGKPIQPDAIVAQLQAFLQGESLWLGK